MKRIAKIQSDFSSKFGIPRQSGLVLSLRATITFEPEYRNPDALRGLEEFSHIWVLWEFSESQQEHWSPTVRPPRLGGNRRMGVFATRSPFRPNPICLSCVKLDKIDWENADGPVLCVSGGDFMDGTPVFDIKPYLPFTDSHPEAVGGFAGNVYQNRLVVCCAEERMRKIPSRYRKAVIGILEEDPRPAYQHDPKRVYGMEFAGMEIRFSVEGDVLTVQDVITVKKE